MDKPPAPRIVLAKVGLDGHDRGIKVVARGLRDAGMHVIYAGLWQTPEAVVRTVADEDAEWLGISLLSGAHFTLVPRLLELLKEAGLEHVKVLVGGALLGDRFRMAGLVDDEGVFIRSLAAAPGHGALAEHLEPMIRLLEAFGFETILIETVGAGQGDTVVVDLADVVVLLLQPEA